MDIPVTLRWIVAYKDVLGNEMTDKLAKQAFQQGINGNKYYLLSAAKQRIRRLTKENWEAIWEAYTGGTKLRRYILRPHHSVRAFHEGVQKVVSSVIIQLRTKIVLKDLLHIYRAVNLPQCAYREGRQTRDHILMVCPLHLEDRQATWGGALIDIKKILSDSKLTQKAAKFMIRTGTLKVFGDVIIKELKESPELLSEVSH